MHRIASESAQAYAGAHTGGGTASGMAHFASVIFFLKYKSNGKNLNNFNDQIVNSNSPHSQVHNPDPREDYYDLFLLWIFPGMLKTQTHFMHACFV